MILAVSIWKLCNIKLRDECWKQKVLYHVIFYCKLFVCLFFNIFKIKNVYIMFCINNLTTLILLFLQYIKVSYWFIFSILCEIVFYVNLSFTFFSWYSLGTVFKLFNSNYNVLGKSKEIGGIGSAKMCSKK